MSAEEDKLFNKEIWSAQESLKYVDQLFLMDSPQTVVLIWILYLIFILKIGPTLMKHRPALEITKVITIYNVFQVGASAYIIYVGLPILWKEGLVPKCLYHREAAIGNVSTIHFYFLLKITELLDTVFFILRKKYNQASFLHIYHHSYMLLSVWTIVKYDPSYVNLFLAVLNATVHLVMYSYYGLAIIPQMAKYLWWKKYITTMQLIQFLLVTAHMLRSYYAAECPPSFLLTFSMIGNMIIFIVLFSNFYIKSYKKPERTAEASNEGAGKLTK